MVVVLLAGTGTAQEKKTPAGDSEKRNPSPLHHELSLKHYDDALKVMSLEQDIDAIDPLSGRTALGIAAQDESADAYDMVKALVVRYGADPSIADQRGLTPLHYAAHAGNLAVVELLVNNRADVNVAPEFPGCSENCPKITPLHMALMMGRNRVATWLEANGADKLDEEVRKDLEFQAKMLDAVKAMDNPPPPGVDKAEWKRRSFERQAERIAYLFEAEGRIREAGEWRQMIDPLWQALENNVLEEGMPIEVFLQNMMQAVVAGQNTRKER